jgi:hypothetical protein
MNQAFAIDETIQKRFEPLYRAAKALEATPTVGITLIELRDLVQKALTEISIARDKSSTKYEREIIDLYEAGINPYLDSLKLFKARLESKNPNGIACVGEVDSIALKYDFDCMKWEAQILIPNESLQLLWEIGINGIKRANMAYLGKPQSNNKKELDALRKSIFGQFSEKIQNYNIRMELIKKQVAIDNLIIQKKEYDLTNALREVVGILVKPCDKYCEHGTWYWIDPVIRKMHANFGTKELAIIDASMNASIRSRYSKDNKWANLLKLSAKVRSEDEVVCIVDDGPIYHKKGCDLLDEDGFFLCIRKSDLPETYKKCPICGD